MSDEECDDTVDAMMAEKIASINHTPVLDEWEQDMFVREAMMQHDLDLCDTSALPTAAIVATLFINVSIFMFFCSVMWSKPQLAIFYTPSQFVSAITLVILYPLRMLTWWPIRNLFVLIVFAVNMLSFAFCTLPFIDDCYRFWAYQTADHALCKPTCFENTTPMVEFFSFFFACNSVAIAFFVMITSYNIRACDKYF